MQLHYIIHPSTQRPNPNTLPVACPSHGTLPWNMLQQAMPPPHLQQYLECKSPVDKPLLFKLVEHGQHKLLCHDVAASTIIYRPNTTQATNNKAAD